VPVLIDGDLELDFVGAVFELARQRSRRRLRRS
jgi:hypothetical protein